MTPSGGVVYNIVMKTQQQLINNIIGQLKGVSRMIEEKKDCLGIVTQMKAAQSAMSSLMNKYIEENFIRCAKSSKEESDNDLINKLLIELIKK